MKKHCSVSVISQKIQLNWLHSDNENVKCSCCSLKQRRQQMNKNDKKKIWIDEIHFKAQAKFWIKKETKYYVLPLSSRATKWTGW